MKLSQACHSRSWCQGRSAAYRLQRLVLPSSGAVSWTVLGPDGWPVAPVESFLAYVRALERSLHTVRAYGHGLALFFEFLVFVNLWAEPHGRPLTYAAVADLVK